MRRIAAALLTSIASLTAHAGSAVGSFDVHINLMVPASPASGLGQVPAGNGFCTSESLSEKTQATVTVVCATGQFVSIKPMPGKPFPGSHGGAYRYVMDRASVGPPSSSEFNPFIGTGTVTSLRVLDIGGRESLLEFLVSF
jgi:hypothetical protein